MAYSDYGAFVYRNGERRKDKEDVGVYDTDEASLPSGVRIFANIMKNRGRGTDEWCRHSQHGVMGDGQVRVACYKQGLPSSGIYYWPEGAAAPEWHDPQSLTDTPGAFRLDYEYGSFEVVKEFGAGEYRFTFTDKEHAESGRYEATMTEPDGTQWTCVYDYGYGAGLTGEDDVTLWLRFCANRSVPKTGYGAAKPRRGSSASGPGTRTRSGPAALICTRRARSCTGRRNALAQP